MPRLTLAAVAAGLLAFTAACDQYGTPTDQGPSNALVRVINAVPDASDVTLLLNGVAVADGIEFPSASDYVQVEALQQHSLAVRDMSGALLGQLSLSPLRGSHYSVLAFGDMTGPEVTAIPDKNSPAPANAIQVRMVHVAQGLAALDFYFGQAPDNVAGLEPVHTNLPFEFLTGYYELPPGSYHFLGTSVGTTNVVVNGGSANYVAEGVYTIYIVEAPGGGEPYSVLVVKDM